MANLIFNLTIEFNRLRDWRDFFLTEKERLIVWRTTKAPLLIQFFQNYRKFN